MLHPAQSHGSPVLACGMVATAKLSGCSNVYELRALAILGAQIRPTHGKSLQPFASRAATPPSGMAGAAPHAQQRAPRLSRPLSPVPCSAIVLQHVRQLPFCRLQPKSALYETMASAAPVRSQRARAHASTAMRKSNMHLAKETFAQPNARAPGPTSELGGPCPPPPSRRQNFTALRDSHMAPHRLLAPPACV